MHLKIELSILLSGKLEIGGMFRWKTKKGRDI